ARYTPCAASIRNAITWPHRNTTPNANVARRSERPDARESNRPDTRRRPTSSVILEAINVSMLAYTSQGRCTWTQSAESPARTTSALVYAANDIVIAPIAAHTPVRAGDATCVLIRPA